MKTAQSEAVNTVFPADAKAQRRVVGFSKNSLKEAFDRAIRQAQVHSQATGDPRGARGDSIATYTLVRDGRLVGGHPGFNSYFAEVEIS